MRSFALFVCWFFYIVWSMMHKTVSMSVPAEPAFARSVRMMAANLAVVAEMGVDDVEDLRMAAEEGFVFCCATNPEICEITFQLAPQRMEVDFKLGSDPSEDDPALQYADLLLSAVCDEYTIDTEGNLLHLVKSVGAADDQD